MPATRKPLIARSPCPAGAYACASNPVTDTTSTAASASFAITPTSCARRRRLSPTSRGRSDPRFGAARSPVPAPHDYRGVVAAEAERVRDADGGVRRVARLVRDVVEVALGVRLLVVDRRRQLPAADR